MSTARDVNPTATPVPSPCINICKMDAETDWCEGCWRTMDEIIAWGNAPESVKQKILQHIDQRKQQQTQNDLSRFDKN